MSALEDPPNCIAFEGARRIAQGLKDEIAPTVRDAIARANEPVLVFDLETSQPVEIAPHGAPAPPARRPGRPKLGVIAREVTLLPRHWDWLARQPGGASVALRRLVEEARRSREDADKVRAAQEAAYRFMSVMAGNRPGFEEATRALFRKDRERFAELVRAWPEDVRAHLQALAAGAF